jgi:hypothetical protein
MVRTIPTRKLIEARDKALEDGSKLDDWVIEALAKIDEESIGYFDYTIVPESAIVPKPSQPE